MVVFMLAVSDAMVPSMKNGIPEPLMKKLQPGKISGFLCCGNIGKHVYFKLRRIATDVRRVAGDQEESEWELPRQMVFEIENVRVALVYGNLVMPKDHEYALDALRRKLAVDVLISGSTGKASTRERGRGLLIDPGSITGALVSPLSTGEPSYTLISFDEGKVTAWTYTLKENDEIKFSRHDWVKPHDTVTSTEATKAAMQQYQGSAPKTVPHKADGSKDAPAASAPPASTPPPSAALSTTTAASPPAPAAGSDAVDSAAAAQDPVQVEKTKGSLSSLSSLSSVCVKEGFGSTPMPEPSRELSLPEEMQQESPQKARQEEATGRPPDSQHEEETGKQVAATEKVVEDLATVGIADRDVVAGGAQADQAAASAPEQDVGEEEEGNVAEGEVGKEGVHVSPGKAAKGRGWLAP